MDINQYIKDINLFLFDMDGTLYIGNRLFPFTKELLNTIKIQGKKYLFMTNNSSKSVRDYVLKLKKLGIEANIEDFITSSQVTADYLTQHYKNKKLYVCGTKSFIKELQDKGFTVTDDLNDVECVVMGFDTELTFKKLEDVSKLLITKNLPYIATNPDLVCPTEFGSVPDCGSVCQIIFNATGKTPTVIGKPQSYMPIAAMKNTGYNNNETAVIGDRIYTDIKSALNANIKNVLVLSGETTIEILKASKDKPDVVLNDCGEILNILKQK